MGRDSRNGSGGPANDPTPAQFGWRPDAPTSAISQEDALPVLPPVRESDRVSPNGHTNGHAGANDRRNGQLNGHARSTGVRLHHPERTSTAILDRRPAQPPVVRELQTIKRLEQLDQLEASPSPSRRPIPGLPKVTLHGLVVLTIIAVVAGHGYWNEIPQAAPPPTDSTRNLRLGELPTTGLTAPSNTSFSLISSASNFDNGYLAQFSTAIIPERLDIQTVRSTEGQSIADIAKQTGRSVDTLLWANSLTDPTAPLAAGTDVRVPPVDGMLHVVHDGDTLESIAARYQVDVSAITGYGPNNVQSTSDLVPYRMIMVPGGKMPTRDQVVTYVVREGDSLASIAQYFGLQPSTILWANSLPNGDLIFPGQKLAILPADGVMITVKDGDTVNSLAEKYGVKAKDILDYPLNGLGAGGALRVGQQVMIPGGAPPPPPPTPTPVPAPQTQQASSAPSQSQSAPVTTQAATGHFIWPTNGSITQYFGPTSFWMEPAYAGYAHFHQGMDIANAAYTPIVAADSGTVVFAGWNTSGYGYAVSINHGNGLVTWYGHMAEPPAVWVGEYVNQGQYLGPMGTTGASSGNHLHFGVLLNGVWVNPLKYLP